ncbi:tetratricopeptide repeat protein [Propioniciclava soli]|uniref:tetratricopeptide repeat protein n=1 Tax=Propioniciclava soli TaxID=2775081 RepID=UPI001E469432|nr:tetratricopeptide repeat protein [Propioniciclava soli]
MTSLPFAGGAMDLSALKPAPPAPAGATYVTTADDRTFESVLGLSMKHPLVVEFTSPRANAQALSDVLDTLANEAGGAYLLVRVDVDAATGIAQALGIQAVPMVVGVVGGQLAPLFQGTADAADAKAAIDQLLQVAAANGLTGHAQPLAPAAGEETAGPDPRFEAADAKLAAGDFAGAVAEFDRLLAANPADAEASAGRAQARLLVRIQEVDAAGVVERLNADPNDVEAALAVADLEVANGDVAAAFGRLIELVRASTGEQRDTVRTRLLELFETVGGTDPAVLKARRDLTSALF